MARVATARAAAAAALGTEQDVEGSEVASDSVPPADTPAAIVSVVGGNVSSLASAPASEVKLDGEAGSSTLHGIAVGTLEPPVEADTADNAAIGSSVDGAAPLLAHEAAKEQAAFVSVKEGVARDSEVSIGSVLDMDASASKQGSVQQHAVQAPTGVSRAQALAMKGLASIGGLRRKMAEKRTDGNI